MTQFGTLYIVATPIGHLQDMSLRAINTLQRVNLIAAEDTRHSLPLLQHFSIKTKVIAFHDHNEAKQVTTLLSRLKGGESIALISDAGTPLISDPGYLLVREARKNKIPVQPIPGPSALIAALSVSGLATNRFIFEGFLPTKSTERKNRLDALQNETRTMIFYEAPHRILKLMGELKDVFGNERQAVIARELTKLYETIKSDTLAGLYDSILLDKDQARGEIVVLIAGKETSSPATDEVNNQLAILKVLVESLPLKQAVHIATKITGINKNKVYRHALKFKIENH